MGLRENASDGGTIGGSHGAPIVVSALQLADVRLPELQSGQARSLIVRRYERPEILATTLSL